MTQINYLERPKQNDPFHSVMGVVGYMTSPFVSTTGAEKTPVEETKKDEHQISMNEDEARNDSTKRVMFHPDCVVSGNSGEDLAFDMTKIYNPANRNNDDEQRDEIGILSNSNSAIVPEQNLNLTPNEVYTGMSKRCRKDLLQDDADSPGTDNSDSITKKQRMKNNIKKLTKKPKYTPAKTFSTPSNKSYLKELKVTVRGNNTGIQQPGKFTSRWQKERKAAEIAKAFERDSKGFISDVNMNTDTDTRTSTKRSMSPQKFSVGKINQARSGPVPKSDDFFAEMKKWHTDYALRQVEKPREITVTTIAKATVGDDSGSDTTTTTSKGNTTTTSKGNTTTTSKGNTTTTNKGNQNQTIEKKKRKFSLRKAKTSKHPTVDVLNGVDDPTSSIEVTDQKIIKRFNKLEKKKAKKMEQEKKADDKKEIKKVAADTKMEQKKEKMAVSENKKMQKKAKRLSTDANKNKAYASYSANKELRVVAVIECMNDDGSVNEMSIEESSTDDSTKGKKKFWKIPKIMKRKQKNTDSIISSNSSGRASNRSIKLVPLVHSTLGITEHPTEAVAPYPTLGITQNPTNVVAPPPVYPTLGIAQNPTKAVPPPPVYPTLGITQNPTKVPMKGPETSFNDTLSKFLKLQLETREDQNSTELSDVRGEKSCPSESKEVANNDEPRERAATMTTVLVETVVSNEEESSNIVDNDDGGSSNSPKAKLNAVLDDMLKAKLEPKLEPKAETAVDEPPKEDTVLEADASTESIEVVGLPKTDSWLKKTAGFFKKDEQADPPAAMITGVDETKESTDAEVKGQDKTTEPIEALEEDDKREEEKELLPEEANSSHTETVEELKEKDPWLGVIAGLFKKDEKAAPPVMVVEVDQYDIDKYKAVAEADLVDKCDGTEIEAADEEDRTETVLETKTVKNQQQDAVPIEASNVGEDAVPIELSNVEEEGNFLQNHCPCLSSAAAAAVDVPQQPAAETNNDEAGERQIDSVVVESQQTNLSWLEMATGFFTTNTQTEVPTEDVENKEEIEKDSCPNPTSLEGVSVLETPKAFNGKTTGFISTGDDNGDALEEPEQVVQSDDSHDSLATSEEGTGTDTYDDSQTETFDGSLNTREEGTFEDSLLTKAEHSFDNSQFTSEKGTAVIKLQPAAGSETMKSLMDLEACQSSQSLAATADEEGTTESRSCADTPNNNLGTNNATAIESRPCADSNQEDKGDHHHRRPSTSPSLADSKSLLCVSEPPKGADSFSCPDSFKTSGDASKISSTNIIRPTEVIFLPKKKNKKTAEKNDTNESENCNLRAYKEPVTTKSMIFFGKQQQKKQKKRVEKVAAKKTNQKKVETRGGATLFGRLEPIPETKKKQKKKAKHAQTLF